MPSSEKTKIKVTKPRKKAAAGEIKVKRTRKKAAPAKGHVIDLRDQPLVSIPARPIEPSIPIESAPAEPAISPYAPAPERVRDQQAPTVWPFGVYRRIAVTFIVLSVISLLAVAYFSLVKLEIRATPAVATANAVAGFTVYDRPETYTVPAGSTLGMVREMEVEHTQTFPATGEKALGAEVAGTVTIINNYTKDQPLVASTRLLSPTNQLLRLRETVLVPAGGSVTAEVYSEAIDPTFTLADSRLTIPGLWAGLQDQIYAEAKAGDVTYKQQVELSVAQADIDKAIADGKAALEEKARLEIESAYRAYDQKLYTLDDASFTFETAAKAGDVREEFSVTFSGTVTVVAFNAANVEGIVGTALISATPQEHTLSEEAASPVFRLKSADTEQNIAEIEADVSATTTVSSSDHLIDRAKIVNLSRRQLEDYLDAQPAIKSYELVFTPSFWQFTPQLVDRITITAQ